MNLEEKKAKVWDLRYQIEYLNNIMLQLNKEIVQEMNDYERGKKEKDERGLAGDCGITEES